MPDLFLPMFGQHNVQNALAALAVAGAVGIDDQVVRRAFAMPSAASTGASPAPARSTASSSSTTTRIIPVEIAAVLAAARTVTTGR